MRPVVIIPGYYGSELVDTAANNFEWWITDDSLLHPIAVLNAIRLDTGDPNRIVASGALDHFSLAPFLHIGIYGRLRQYLRDKVGYQPSEIHQVGVDWRQSLTQLAADLDRQIRQIGQSVDVITHSHGGLVARAYLEQFGAGSVNSLITIAVPHKGMFKTWQALHDGFRFLTFPPDHLRRTARTFPSAYELLPYDPADELFHWNGNFEDATSVPDWCETADMKTMLAAANTVVHALPTQLPVDGCFIYGTRLQTTTRCQGSPTGLTFQESTDGDSTVPLVSARGNGITSTGTLRRYPIPLGVHGSLFGDDIVLDLLRQVLTGAPPATWLSARWSQEFLFDIFSENTLVAEFRDELGNMIPGAHVTLTLDNGHPIPLTQGPMLDYSVVVRMPGADSRIRWRVDASAPNIAMSVSGTLVASNN
ncbi:MAG TPA: hypothetical protein VGJ82_00900 [Thermoanaerobaculia bacterium]|jgi:hypothetical protein